MRILIITGLGNIINNVLSVKFRQIKNFGFIFKNQQIKAF